MEDCSCRENVSSENLRLWNEMLKDLKEGEASVRLKISMQHKNSTMRDPSIMRIIDFPHPRIGEKYRVWPMYDFGTSLMDAWGGVTHRVRSKEFEMRNELQQHIHDLSSASPEDPQFAAHMAIAEKAAKQADQIRTLRARDPAKAVAPFPEDAEAEAKWLESPDDPETVQDLVRARIAAQQKIGLSDAEISPITREEARQAIAPALGLKGPALVEQLTSLSGQLEEKYGEYAPAVARSAIRTAVRSAEEAEIIQGVLSRAWRGKPVLAAQVRQLEELAEATDAERALMPMAYTGEPFRQMGVPTETTRFPRKSAMPPAGDAFTQFAGKPFSVETIEQARRLPPGTQFYDPNGVLRTR